LGRLFIVDNATKAADLNITHPGSELHYVPEWEVTLKKLRVFQTRQETKMFGSRKLFIFVDCRLV